MLVVFGLPSGHSYNLPKTHIHPLFKPVSFHPTVLQVDLLLYNRF